MLAIATIRSTNRTPGIGGRLKRLGAGRKNERGVALARHGTLIDHLMHFTSRFKKHRAGRVYGYATIAVELCHRPGLHHNDDGTGVGMPASVTTRLNHDLGLEDIGRPFFVDAHPFETGSSCENFERQRWRLGDGGLHVDKKPSNRSCYGDGDDAGSEAPKPTSGWGVETVGWVSISGSNWRFAENA